MNYQQAIVQQILVKQKQQAVEGNAKGQRNMPQSNDHESHGNHAQTRAIKVHFNNYIETGINALKIGFPTLYGLLDHNDFRRLCYQYLIQHPKTCFDWSDYGQDLDNFILDIDALSTQPFLSDIAKLDTQLLQIERLPDKGLDHVSFELMQQEEFADLLFVGASGLSLTKSLFPIVELYQLVHDYNNSADERNIEHGSKAAHLKNLNNLLDHAIKSPQYRSIIVWREQYKGRFTYCSEQAYLAYSSVIAQESVAQVFSHFNDDEAGLTAWLQTSIQNHQIIGIVRAGSLSN